MAVFATSLGGTAVEPVVDAVNGFFLAVPDFLWAFALVLLFGVFAPSATFGPHRPQP